jgi:hypothetical protein
MHDPIPGRTRLEESNKSGYRPATLEEVEQFFDTQSRQWCEAAVKAGVCFVSNDGQTFLVNNLSKVQSIITEKMLREL